MYFYSDVACLVSTEHYTVKYLLPTDFSNQAGSCTLKQTECLNYLDVGTPCASPYRDLLQAQHK